MTSTLLLADDASSDARQPHAAKRGTSVLGAAMIMASFSTASSNIMYPFIYGTLGVVVGPLLGVLVQGLVCALSIHALEVAVAAECSTLGQLGHVLGGQKGRRLLETVQMLNNVLFLPVALVISSGALKKVVLSVLGCADSGGASAPVACVWWDCNVHPLLLTCVLTWPLLLFARDFGHMSGLAIISMILISAQTVIIIYYAAVTDPVAATPRAPFSWGPTKGTYYLLLTNSLLLTPYYLLLTTYYVLLTTHYLLLTTYYLLLTTYHLPLTTYYLLLRGNLPKASSGTKSSLQLPSSSTHSVRCSLPSKSQRA